MKHKTASEIFSLNAIKNQATKIKQGGYKCPFLDKKCVKQSRLINYPMGVCSVYSNDRPIIVCPQRFLQNKTIMKDTANTFLGGIDNILEFSEIKLKNIGTFDFVLVKHQPLSSKVDDFLILEIQSDSTTGTGKLVKNLRDYIESGENTIEKRYGFGMNTYNTIKLSFIQMLNKGMVIEKWGKHIIWVMQDFVFTNMLTRFELSKNEFSKDKNIHFFIYKLETAEPQSNFSLKLNSTHSYRHSELLNAFSRERSLPSLDKFIEKLENKLKIELQMKLT